MKKTKISRITVSRLYNLGNYENCSYTITVDVPDGQSAARAVFALEKILAGLKPLRNVFTPVEAERKRAELIEMRKLTPERFRQRYGSPDGGRRAYAARCWKDLAESIADSKVVFARAKKARDLFDDLGGAEKWKDAKLDWEDDRW